MNQDEALRCIDIALQFWSEGKLPQAIKFLNKSIHLYPTDKARELLTKYEEQLTKSPHTHASTTQQAQTEAQSNTPHTPTPSNAHNYTQEQLDAVLRVKKCKDYYSVLGVTRRATDVEIKKQYRKLALLMHPDKNHAPGAEEAFKAVSQAFACLNDPMRRSQYDQLGYEPSQHNIGAREHFRTFDSDISPEELFEMMFNLRPNGGFRTYTFRTDRGHAPRHAYRRGTNSNGEGDGTSFLLLLQLLPLLILVLSMLAWSSSYDEPLFSLKKMGAYTVNRYTKERRVEYFIKQDTEEQIISGGVNLASLETQVEINWLSQMERRCSWEREQKLKMERAAQ